VAILDLPDGQLQRSGPGPGGIDVAGAPATGISPAELRVLAVVAAARHHGVELDRDDLRMPEGRSPEPAALVDWLRGAGLWARGVAMRWQSLLGMQSSGPVVLLLKDGGAVLVVRIDRARDQVWTRDPGSEVDTEPTPLDAAALAGRWDGETILLRADRGSAYDSEPFSLVWLARLVWHDRKLMKEIFVASLMMTLLTIVSMLLIMVVIDRVVTYRSYSTLGLVAMVIGITAGFEAYFGFIRRQLTAVVGRRVESRVNLEMFKRILGLPIDFYEKNQAGAIMYRLGHINSVRDFLTGRVLSTLLDVVTLLLLLPVLYILNPILTWLVLIAAVIMGLIILSFVRPVRRVFNRYAEAEMAKSTVLVESVRGIRTVKSLGLEPQRKEAWDSTTAAVGSWKLELLDLVNWPQTLVHPLEMFMYTGVMLVGVYIAINDNPGAGSLMAFMMLSGRLSQPIAGVARMMEEIQNIHNSVTMAASVMNEAQEDAQPGIGLRPRFDGAISFDKVTFSYPGTKTRALDEMSFKIPAGSTVGLVGRSGSGKSTITRLLQGINREYEGYIKIDGNDLRSINLTHLRRSFGVVLQDNFLFRGTVKDNVIAGRPGLTITDVVRACRLAGAEEFIERMPNGYETFIEEGSPNVSGGQRQRLAIARALIHDPRILILDEATSALDPESEALVNANIARIAQGRTMVVVSHRLSSLTEMDQTIVLDRGRVMDVGPHHELVDRCPVYRQLWLQQIRHMDTSRSAVPAALAPAHGL
jgi:ATP-binding cassette subfamily B protein